MPMLEPQWKQERPTLAAVDELWRAPVFKPDPWTSPALEELLAELCAIHTNGGALFARFGFLSHPVLHWFVSRNRFDEIGFFEQLLTSDQLRETLPLLKPPPSLEPIKWEWWTPFILGGDWAQALMVGGPYAKFKKGGRAAKDLGERVCSELFGDRFEEVMVFRTGSPWSPWFFNIAWDLTWVGVDKRHQHVWLLCITDTD